MPISEEAKQVLRERLKLAREAKITKKNKVEQVVKESVEPTAPKVPVVVPLPLETVKEQPKPLDLNSPTDSVPISKPMVKKAVGNQAKSQPIDIPKEPKKKYAKLVFYQEPGSNKKIKKLTKVLENSSSDETDEDFYQAPPPPQQTTDRQLQYNRMSQLSKMIFD
jgi:hypothetical protein